MSNNLITIQEAADLTEKSIQTIRRAIKAKKIKFRRDKTPQGFNYLIDKDSLCSFYEIKLNETQTQQTPEQAQTDSAITQESQAIENNEDTMNVSVKDFKAFAQAMQTMIAQHSEERQSFLRLVNTMQEKIFVLENQVNLLKAPQVKKWYQIWKSKV